MMENWEAIESCWVVFMILLLARDESFTDGHAKWKFGDAPTPNHTRHESA